MKVQIFLKTPLFRGKYGAKRNQELEASIIEIHGTAKAGSGGLELKVSKLFDSKGKETKAPFTSIFLPMAKIDYYVVL
ncbi:MAG: hypothetical protein VX498_02835 [Myxococcota bacterium]|nr:hypothetical protein [Myxococcota bacterium]